MVSMRLSRLSVLVAALAVSAVGCDAARDPVTPRADLSADQVQRLNTTSASYKIIEGPACSEGCTAEAVFGRRGGQLRLGNGHVLYVQKNSVPRNTRFIITATNEEGSIGTDLTAFDLATGARVTTFNNPVYLELSYADATNLSGNLKLAVAWKRNDSIDDLVPQPSWLMSDRPAVLSELQHFSGYIIVGNSYDREAL